MGRGFQRRGMVGREVNIYREEETRDKHQSCLIMPQGINLFYIYLKLYNLYTYRCRLKEVKLLWVNHASHKNHIIRKLRYQT